jgi:hypothetical protein
MMFRLPISAAVKSDARPFGHGGDDFRDLRDIVPLTCGVEKPNMYRHLRRPPIMAPRYRESHLDAWPLAGQVE